MSKITLSQLAADKVTDFIFSWTFVLGHVGFNVLWIIWNTYLPVRHFDPAPFMGLNLILSTEAAIYFSIVGISQQKLSRREENKLDAIRRNLKEKV